MCSKVHGQQLLILIDGFISGRVSAIEFDREYTIAWRGYRDSDDVSEEDESMRMYFDRIFTTLDAYCSIPDLRESSDLDDDGLLIEVVKLNNKLRYGGL